MLEVRDLRVAYDKKQVLHGVSLDVAEGEIVALVGHNGAGKTTLLRAVLGLMPRAAGSIRFLGADLPADRVAAAANRGLAFVPQGRNTFRALTVAENLNIVRAAANGHGRIGLDDIYAMFPVLKEKLGQRAATLSGGQQQMLALALALLRRPKLVMLDEPSTGLAPVLVDGVFATIRQLRERYGVAVLVVDQNIHRLLRIVDRVHVLKAGNMIFDGAPDAVATNDDLWKLF